MTTIKLKVTTAVIGTLLLTGCAGKHLSVADGGKLSLEGCTPLPNCVSSSTWIFYNATEPFELIMPAKDAWPLIKAVVANMPRTEIVEQDDVYLHAKCTSLVFRFVDNLELLLHPEQKSISVRSSSTFAIFDFGANHWRIHKLRSELEGMKLIKQ